ncbi:DNA-primase RepB domain-containing protein [Spirosoma fluviale]|nr:DNA-primase RepB domain-containing protein [Spirosoma fluviale]
MDTITPVIKNYVAAFNAAKYHYRLVHPITGKVKFGKYNKEEFIKSGKFFYAMNQQGFNIYARPIGWQYVLLDDLTREVLTDVASLKPCMLIETSPGNFQAWLILPETPADRDTAKAICKELAVRFGADLASAEPDHVGRVPEFRNQKQKYFELYREYPIVKLWRWEHRQTTFLPPLGGVVQSPVISPPRSNRQAPKYDDSQSAKEYGKICQLIREGKSRSEISDYIMPSILERKGNRSERYFNITIANAYRDLKQ